MATVSETGAIEHKVNFIYALSDCSSDQSWEEELNFFDNRDKTDEAQSPTDNSEDEDACGQEFIYNINGDVIEVINKPEDERRSPDPELKEIVTKDHISINVACTHYDVVKKVAHKVLQWKLCYKKEDDVGAIRSG